jgi:hypothetical protein
MTAKHIKSMFSNEKVAKVANESYICCNCNKKYKDNSGLWRHKKKCFNEVKNEVKNDIKNKSNIPNDENTQELIKYLMKENSEFTPLKI